MSRGATSTPRPATRRRCSWAARSSIRAARWPRPSRSSESPIRPRPRRSTTRSCRSSWRRAGSTPACRRRRPTTLVALKQRMPQAQGRAARRRGGRSSAATTRRWPGWSRSSAAAARRWSLAATQWVMFRGNEARNASHGGGVPLLNYRWSLPTVNDPQDELKVKSLSPLAPRQRASRTSSAPPAAGRAGRGDRPRARFEQAVGRRPADRQAAVGLSAVRRQPGRRRPAAHALPAERARPPSTSAIRSCGSGSGTTTPSARSAATAGKST